MRKWIDLFENDAPMTLWRIESDPRSIEEVGVTSLKAFITKPPSWNGTVSKWEFRPRNPLRVTGVGNLGKAFMAPEADWATARQIADQLGVMNPDDPFDPSFFVKDLAFRTAAARAGFDSVFNENFVHVLDPTRVRLIKEPSKPNRFGDLFEEDEREGEVVRLYRGDAKEVDQFAKGATSVLGLFGSGIYMTSERRVANDYRTKGGGGNVLFTLAGAKTKKDVIDTYIRQQAARFDHTGKDRSGEMAYWSANVPYSDGTDWSVVISDLAKKERNLRIGFATQKWEAMKSEYEVRIKLDGTGVIQKKEPGAGTAFNVPQQAINRCIDAEAEIDETILDTFYSHLRRAGDYETVRDIQGFVQQHKREDGYLPTFRDIYTNLGAGANIIGDREAQDAFHDDLMNLGYTGISYAGGITMGGGFKHRAYVFWDENDVESWRVRDE